MAWRAGNELWHDEKWQIIYMHLPFIDFIKIWRSLSLNDNVYSMVVIEGLNMQVSDDPELLKRAGRYGRSFGFV